MTARLPCWRKPCASNGSPHPHLHRDWAHPAHIYTGTRLTLPTSAPRLGLRLLPLFPCVAKACRLHALCAALLACRRHTALMDAGIRRAQRTNAVCMQACATPRRHAAYDRRIRRQIAYNIQHSTWYTTCDRVASQQSYRAAGGMPPWRNDRRRSPCTTAALPSRAALPAARRRIVSC